MGKTLHEWVVTELERHPQIVFNEPLALNLLRGDAGFRQYFRLNTQPSLLAVSAPQTEGVSESAAYFKQIARTLREEGVPTPQIVACEPEANYLLIEDFGQELFLDMLNPDTCELLYGEALMVLLRLQQIPRSAVTVNDYDQTALREELQLFPDWFVTQLLGLSLSDAERDLLTATFDFLEEQALAQPRVLVHRDFHSRNLIYREGETPGVIDFQDAVWGPITYDLVSLLRDCYISWPPEKVKHWMIAYANLAIELGIMPLTTEARWQYWFDTMGLQRHLKVLGIFSRLWLRDGKQSYLSDLPLVWHYTLTVAAQYPEMEHFYEFCLKRLRPSVEQQSWYREIAVANSNIDDHPPG